MPRSCPATPAGLGSARSRWRAAGCEQSNRLAPARVTVSDGHRRHRSELPLRTSRTAIRSLLSC